MNRISALIDYFKKNRTPKKENTPGGYCPNCWGRQEYGGEFFEVAKNYNADINTPNPNIGWIKDYANKHLSSIELKQKDKQLICEKCKLSYRKEKK